MAQKASTFFNLLNLCLAIQGILSISSFLPHLYYPFFLELKQQINIIWKFVSEGTFEE